MEIAGVAGSLDELRPMLDGPVDVLLLDLRLGEESGFELLRDAADVILPAVVCLTSYDYPQYADAAMRLGALGSSSRPHRPRSCWKRSVEQRRVAWRSG